MSDQADRLRSIIKGLKEKQAEKEKRAADQPKKSARIITVTSGKGGVGKSNITANLAIALSELGVKVAVIDADFGLANIDVLLGIAPRFTLLDVMKKNRNIFEVLATGPGNIRFLSGGSGVEELASLDDKELEIFLSGITLMDKLFDIILIDTGAGISQKVMNFVMAADEVLLVATPEPTSITDAYALIKMVAKRDRQKIVKLIINRAKDKAEADDVITKLKLVAEKFLKLNLVPMGYIVMDETVVKAVKAQKPFIIYYPNSQASKYIREIAKRIAENETMTGVENLGIKRFMTKFLKTFNLKNRQNA